jgi:8-oxo-dGTP diphosphatase
MVPVVISTPRLTLRALTERDTPRLVAALNDWEVVRWLARVPFPYTIDHAMHWCVMSTRDWAADTAYPFNAFEGSDLVGGIGLTRVSRQEAILGYWLVRSHWGQGLGTEMIEAIARFGLLGEPGFVRLIAGTHPQNHASQRLLLRCGFVDIGERVFIHPPREGLVTGPHYMLTRSMIAEPDQLDSFDTEDD